MTMIHVDTNGDNGSEGTLAKPLRTVQHAVAVAQPGDVVILAPGVRFVEDVTIRTPGVTLKGAAGKIPWLQGRLYIAKGADDVRIFRLRLDGESPSNLPSPTVNAARTLFDYCEVTNRHTTIGFSLGHPQYGAAVDTTITRCRIHQIGLLPPQNHHHGIYAGMARGLRVSDCFIYDCPDRGIQFFPDPQSCLVERCIIDDCGIGVIWSGDETHTSNACHVNDSIITNSRVRGCLEEWSPVRRYGATNSASHCLVGGTPPGFQAIQPGHHFTCYDVKEINPDGLYINQPKRDYRLVGTTHTGYGPNTRPILLQR